MTSSDVSVQREHESSWKFLRSHSRCGLVSKENHSHWTRKASDVQVLFILNMINELDRNSEDLGVYCTCTSESFTFSMESPGITSMSPKKRLPSGPHACIREVLVTWARGKRSLLVQLPHPGAVVACVSFVHTIMIVPRQRRSLLPHRTLIARQQACSWNN